MERRLARLAMAMVIVFAGSLFLPLQNITLENSGVNLDTNKNSSCVICINELMPNADGSDQGIFPQGEWVELFNTGSSSVSLEGWTIVDIGGWTHQINENTWVGFSDLPTPYLIEPGAYVVIAENEIGTLRLNNVGETFYLKDCTKNLQKVL